MGFLQVCLLLMMAILESTYSEDIPISDEHIQNSSLNSLLDNAVTACDCGWRNKASKGLQIVGGNETGLNEFPFMAALVQLKPSAFNGGATIISDRYLLTAAHVVYGQTRSNLGILVGDHDISVGYDTPYSALYYVSDYVTHPNYNTKTYVNDIAIIYTASKITFSNYVAPVCLPFFTYDFAGELATILGWGSIEFSGPTSNTLQKANVQIISNSVCSSYISVTSGSVCTYANGKDSCQADSGGPVLWTSAYSNRMYLAGIISNGVGCGLAVPSLNTRVTYYLNWVLSKTSDAQYCQLPTQLK